MKLIDADKFIEYLIFSKHIDSLKCGEVKEAIEECRVNVLDDIRAEIKKRRDEVANVLTFDNTAYEKYQTMMETYDEWLDIIKKGVEE